MCAYILDLLTAIFSSLKASMLYQRLFKRSFTLSMRLGTACNSFNSVFDLMANCKIHARTTGVTPCLPRSDQCNNFSTVKHFCQRIFELSKKRWKVCTRVKSRTISCTKSWKCDQCLRHPSANSTTATTMTLPLIRSSRRCSSTRSASGCSRVRRQ